jgi:hypothetical protein
MKIMVEVVAMLAEIFKPFMEKSPVSVMVRGATERLLSPGWVDRVFEETADGQYTRRLLFSGVFGLMCQVVLGHRKSIHAAYMPNMEEIGVSITSVYNKLNGISTVTSSELVRESAAQCAEIVREMGGERAPWLEGYRIRILDGNCIEASEHRLKALRETGAGALPGKSLVVYDPQLSCVVEVMPWEDGHAQERALLGPITAMVEPGDLWIADRNFCCRGFIQAIIDAKAFIVFRQHQGLPVRELGKRRRVGTCATGVLFEQQVEMVLEDGGTIRLRRITIRLKKATRDGDEDLHLLTNLPDEVGARALAKLYAGRWRVETVFQDIERDLNSEINALGYPQAALFAFCTALVAYNILMLVHAALRAQHGEEKIAEEFSNYYLADEIAATHRGMMISIPDEHWRAFSKMSPAAFASLLLLLASKIRLELFKKHKRGPKKPRQKPKADPSHPHVSTARLLTERRGK